MKLHVSEAMPNPLGENVVDKWSGLARIYNAATAFWQPGVRDANGVRAPLVVSGCL